MSYTVCLVSNIYEYESCKVEDYQETLETDFSVYEVKVF